MKNHALAVLAVAGMAAAANADIFVGSGFAIPDNNAAGASGTANVAGMGLVTDLNLILTFGTGASGGTNPAGNREHTWVDDLIITLTSPTGTIVTVYSRQIIVAAGSGEDLNGTYVFDDAAGTLFVNAPVTSGNVNNGTYASPGALSGFNGVNPNGTWTLNIADRAGQDVGDIVSWSLDIVPTPGAAAMLGLGALASMRRRRA